MHLLLFSPQNAVTISIHHPCSFDRIISIVYGQYATQAAVRAKCTRL